MRHEIHWTRDHWLPAVMVWDDVTGTLEWAREPENPPSSSHFLVRQGLTAAVERARREGRIVLQTEPETYRYVLEDAAHDPADFLRLIDYEIGCVRCGDVRLPPSLRDVEMTRAEVFELPPGVVA